MHVHMSCKWQNVRCRKGGKHTQAAKQNPSLSKYALAL